MTHTNGSWFSEPRDIGGYLVGSSRDGLPIAIVPTNHRPNKEVEANAYLIAAAPDLLAALKGVVAVADRKTDEFDRAHAAITKAGGRQS